MEKTVNVQKCPACGAVLPDADGADTVRCEYCDTEVLLREKDPEEERRQREEERRLKVQKEKEKIYIIVAITGVVACVIGVIMMIVDDPVGDSEHFGNVATVGLILMIFGFIGAAGGIGVMVEEKEENERERQDIAEGKIKVPDAAIHYGWVNYAAVEQALRSAGFTNIRCVPMGDLSANAAYTMANMTEFVTVDGQPIYSIGERQLPSAQIVISYHSVRGTDGEKACGVTVPNAVLNFREMDCSDMERAFCGAGFTNVRCTALGDLSASETLDGDDKPYMVDSVEVDGRKIYTGGGRYAPDVPVVIRYHSFK